MDSSDPYGSTHSAPPAPYVGTVAQGKYRFVRLLGEGGMGAVYEGENIAIHRRVAIKCLHAHLARSAEMVSRFRNEALAATRINNEHVVEVLDMGQLPDGAFYIVLEYLEGREFAALLTEQRVLPLGRTARIVRQVLIALSAAHEKGVVHRDIKPQNVYLVRRGGSEDFVKLLDFGIAKLANNSGMETRTGAQMGTPFYMSPEQAIASKNVDHRTDLFAVGVLLFRCVAGHHPWEADNLALLVYQLMHQAPPDLRALRPDLPRGFTDLVMRMIERDPNARPESARACADALAVYENDAGGVPGPVVWPTPGAAPVTSETGPMKGGASAAAPAPGPSDSSGRPSSVTGFRMGGTLTNANFESIAPSRETQEAGRRDGGAARTALIVGATVLVIGLGALVARAAFLGGTSTPSAPSSAPTASPEVASALALARAVAAARAASAEPTAPMRPPSVPAATAAPVAAGPRVRVEIDVQPEGAELLIDGRPVHNPYDADLPPSDALRRVEARSPGFRSEVHEIVLNEPQRVHIRLARGAGSVTVSARPAARSTAAMVPAQAASAPREAVPSARPAQAVATSAPAAPARPSEDPRPSGVPAQPGVPPPAQGLRHIEL